MSYTGTQGGVRHDTGWFGTDDLHLFNEGNHYRLYRKLGTHLAEHGGEHGAHFSVWAPSARRVSVMGDFNGWNKTSHPLRGVGTSGVWSGFVPGIAQGAHYKYHVVSHDGDHRVDKADPFAFRQELPPRTSSLVWDLEYGWNDTEWMRARAERNRLDRPCSIYEVHLGSWMRVAAEGNRSLSYEELGVRLVDYVAQMRFTHVELLPVMEHPFFGSWGYQVTGYFAASSRYGSPQDLMRLIDRFHERGIGVILDWVPSHFPNDEHGLAFFDGSHVYEHADRRQGFHPDWKSGVFNYGRHEVRSFLVSSALFWLDAYHADGLRVDGVASMLYLDYSREPGEWVPNRHGGNENLEAVAFLQQLNEDVYEAHPDVQTIAEESTSWPGVSRPVHAGGLGFGLKWDMGWMHDTLEYMARDPIHRKYHHDEIAFRMMYAFHENFVLPLSHDEVVHGKGSLLGRMPGDEWQRRANLRALFGYMYGQPGKKLLFMGGEFGEATEWNHDASLTWGLLEQPGHRGIQQWVRDLNEAYQSWPALHERDCEQAGFDWVDCQDTEKSVLSFLRKSANGADSVLVVCNFTPIPWASYRVGVPLAGRWTERLNSDADAYGGSGIGNLGGVDASAQTAHGQPYSLTLELPPLATLFLMAPEVGG
jgi:1,4-alpha-glucan branching enzyme